MFPRTTDLTRVAAGQSLSPEASARDCHAGLPAPDAAEDAAEDAAQESTDSRQDGRAQCCAQGGAPEATGRIANIAGRHLDVLLPREFAAFECGGCRPLAHCELDHCEYRREADCSLPTVAQHLPRQGRRERLLQNLLGQLASATLEQRPNSGGAA